MNNEAMTMEEIRAHGLQVLSRELGPVGAARFIQQFENGRGDYSADRQQWLGEDSVADLLVQLEKREVENL